ncbi:MAG: hypothetical protein OEV44_02645 [Spirochaetota bacterium]|nr:hypothetical protein [Spirochaetota bacterium]
MRHEEIIENLIISVMAINNFYLEKAYNLKEKLLKENLFNLETLKNSSSEQLFEKIVKSGYKKSDYVIGLLVDRFKDIGNKLSPSVLDQLLKAVVAKDINSIEKILLPIHGVGYFVIKNFNSLCEI